MESVKVEEVSRPTMVICGPVAELLQCRFSQGAGPNHLDFFPATESGEIVWFISSNHMASRFRSCISGPSDRMCRLEVPIEVFLQQPSFVSEGAHGALGGLNSYHPEIGWMTKHVGCSGARIRETRFCDMRHIFLVLLKPHVALHCIPYFQLSNQVAMLQCTEAWGRPHAAF